MPPRALDPRITEHRNPRSANIDLATPLEIVDIMTAEDRRVPDAVATQREQIASAISRIEQGTATVVRPDLLSVEEFGFTPKANPN